MIASRLAIATAVALATAGCSQSHTPTVAGIDPSTRLVDLSDEQWLALCMWAEDQRGGEAAVYSCEGTELRPDLCPSPRVPPCWTYDWRWTGCFADAPGSTRFHWRHAVDSSCSVTVSEWATCVSRLAELVCWLGSPDPAECQQVRSCDPPPRCCDAGVSDGS